MPKLSDRIMRRLRARGRGNWVFTPSDFTDIGTRAGVDQALSRLTKDRVIRRVGRGFYDWPRYSSLLGRPAPVSIGLAVQALSRRDGIRLMPGGMDAANDLGLTNAVPAKLSHATDGPSRDIRIGGRTISLRHVGPKRIAWAGRPAAPVIQALRWLGSGTIAADDRIQDILRRKLPDTVKRDLIDGMRLNLAPAWMIPVLQAITADAHGTPQ